MDVQAALKDGYTQDEVMAELGRRTGMNYQQALSDGHSADEVLAELTRRETSGAVKKNGGAGGSFDDPSLNDKLMTRQNKISEILTPQKNESLWQSVKKSPGRALDVAGQVAGGAIDMINVPAEPILSASMKGISALGKAASSTAGTIAGAVMPGAKTAIDALKGISDPTIRNLASEAIKYGGEKWASFKQAYPEWAQHVESVVNIASVLPLGEAAKGAAGAAKEILPNAAKSGEALLNKKIDYAINKAVRPSIVKKEMYGQVEKYKGQTRSAVQDIVKNKPNLEMATAEGDVIKGELPKNLNQFSQAIEQTKRSIFDRYDSMAQETGKAGIAIDLTPIADELKPILNNKPINKFFPETAKYARDMIEQLAGDTLTPSEAQQAIKGFNESLANYYRNPTPETKGRAYVDAMMANKLRSSLDETIEKTVGAGYQDLKTRYGALRTIEKDVTKRSIVDARKNIKGFFDLSDVFSGYHVINGLLSGSPEAVVSGAGAKGISAYMKYLNDPNRIIKRMFSDVERLMPKTGMEARTVEDSVKPWEKPAAKTYTPGELPTGKSAKDSANVFAGETKSAADSASVFDSALPKPLSEADVAAQEVKTTERRKKLSETLRENQIKARQAEELKAKNAPVKKQPTYPSTSSVDKAQQEAKIIDRRRALFNQRKEEAIKARKIEEQRIKNAPRATISPEPTPTPALEPVKAAEVAKAEPAAAKTSVNLPDFKNADEATKFAWTATPEQITAMKTKEEAIRTTFEDLRAQAKEALKTDKAQAIELNQQAADLNKQAQDLREAYQAKETPENFQEALQRNGLIGLTETPAKPTAKQTLETKRAEFNKRKAAKNKKPEAEK
jgi:hypothetical protein